MRLKKKQRKVIEMLDVPGYSVKQCSKFIEAEELKPELRYRYFEVRGFLACIDKLIKIAEEEKKRELEAAEGEDYE